MKQYFSIKLQELRKQHGLSQEALAEILDVSRQSVSKWESGKIYPEIDKIIFLSEYFNISVDELLKESSEPEKNIVSERRVINLSKQDNMTERKSVNLSEQDIMPERPVFEQDIMPQYKSVQSPEVSFATAQSNVQIVKGNQKKSPKKVRRKKFSFKKFLRPAVIFSIIGVGASTISLCIALCVESASVSESTLIDGSAVVEIAEEAEDVYAEDGRIRTAHYIDDAGSIVEYQYIKDEILNRFFYYYDEKSQNYIRVLIPITEYECDFYGMKTATVFMEQYGCYLDVINFSEENENQNFILAKYFSARFNRYTTVLVPLECSYELESYGYKIVSVYYDSSGFAPTIVKIDEY